MDLVSRIIAAFFISTFALFSLQIPLRLMLYFLPKEYADETREAMIRKRKMFFKDKRKLFAFWVLGFLFAFVCFSIPDFL